MLSIEVPFSTLTRTSSLDDVSKSLDQFDRNYIDKVPWPAFSYQPNVSFVVAHCNDCLFLKYYVAEAAIKAECHQTNEPVYKDSCVEFFISFGTDQQYYNFEFNCIGTGLGGFGVSRQERQLLQPQVMNEIRRQALIRKDRAGVGVSVYWELTIALPLEVFSFHQLSSLSGQQCRVNFYKCGDELPEPHYLSWSGIESESPDFHLPAFFGKMTFA